MKADDEESYASETTVSTERQNNKFVAAGHYKIIISTWQKMAMPNKIHVTVSKSCVLKFYNHVQH